jgi:endonuclease YncB( thermonuclease family)
MIHPRFWLVLGMMSLVAALACTVSSDAVDPTGLSCPDCPAVPVDRVVDGDTFNSSYGRVRLYGADAPERGDQCFSEATDRLRELAGDDVRLELTRLGFPDSRPEIEAGWTAFGRVLAYVYTEAGESVDETLIREGLAGAWTRDGQHRDVLMEAEREAREQGTGCLW